MATPIVDQHDPAAPPPGAALSTGLSGAGTLRLRDGTTLCVRPIRPDDAERLCAFHAGLSRESIVFRFFRILPELPPDLAERFTHVDYENRMALVATLGDGPAERILAVARYDRIGPTEAEVAFVVADQWQGHGIATALLYRLAAYARAHGCTTFVAYTMGTNQRMLDVFRYAGYPHTTTYSEGEVEVRLDITADVAAPLPHTS